MKIILKNNHEIEITRSNINYNAKIVDDEKNSIVLTIENPEVEVDELIEVLTPENITEVKIVSDTVEVTKKGLKLSAITQNIADDRYNIDIRFSI